MTAILLTGLRENTDEDRICAGAQDVLCVGVEPSGGDTANPDQRHPGSRRIRPYAHGECFVQTRLRVSRRSVSPALVPEAVRRVPVECGFRQKVGIVSYDSGVYDEMERVVYSEQVT